MAVITVSTSSSSSSGTGVTPFGYADNFNYTTETTTVSINFTADSYGTPTIITEVPTGSGPLLSYIGGAVSGSVYNYLRNSNHIRGELGAFLVPSDGTASNSIEYQPGNTVKFWGPLSASSASHDLTHSATEYILRVDTIGNGLIFSPDTYYFILPLPGAVITAVSKFWADPPSHILVGLSPGSGIASQHLLYVALFLKIPASIPTNFRLLDYAIRPAQKAASGGNIYFYGTECCLSLGTCRSVFGGASGGMAATNYGYASAKPTVRWNALYYSASGSGPSVRANVKWFYPDGSSTVDSSTFTTTNIGPADTFGTDWFMAAATFTPAAIPAGAIYYYCYFDNFTLNGSSAYNTSFYHQCSNPSDFLEWPASGPGGDWIPAIMPVYTG